MYYLEIEQDGVWAGTGIVEGTTIVFCEACLGASKGADVTDDIEGAYQAIETALAAGQTTATYEGVRYDWTVATGV